MLWGRQGEEAGNSELVLKGTWGPARHRGGRVGCSRVFRCPRSIGKDTTPRALRRGRAGMGLRSGVVARRQSRVQWWTRTFKGVCSRHQGFKDAKSLRQRRHAGPREQGWHSKDCSERPRFLVLCSRGWGVLRRGCHLQQGTLAAFLEESLLDFLGGPVVKNPPANVVDTGSISGLGRSHMP